MKPAMFKRSEKNLAKTLDFALTEAAAGSRRVTPAEIKALSDVLRADAPPSYYVLTVLVNAYEFLFTFPADDTERAAIERFLTAFREQAAAELMAKHTTLQDGLKMQVTPNV